MILLSLASFRFTMYSGFVGVHSDACTTAQLMYGTNKVFISLYGVQNIIIIRVQKEEKLKCIHESMRIKVRILIQFDMLHLRVFHFMI